jgi:hypothetical protein
MSTATIESVSQELTDRLDAHSVRITVAQQSADTAQGSATSAITQIYDTGLAAQIYSDAQVQQLREEFNTRLNLIEAGVAEQIDSKVGTGLSGVNPSIAAYKAEMQAKLDDYYARTGVDLESMNDAVDYLTNVKFPGQETLSRDLGLDAEWVKQQLNTLKGGMAVDSILEAIDIAQLRADQINGALKKENFPVDAKPVEIVTVLPTTGNFVGRTVSHNGELKTWNGTKFTNKINTADLVGQIGVGQLAANTVDAAQINANAVTAAKINAGAVTADKIAAGAITTSKMIITAWENLVTNGFFNDPDLDAYDSFGSGGTIQFRTTRKTGQYSLRLDKTSLATSHYVQLKDTHHFPVKDDSDYYWEVAYKEPNGNTSAAGFYYSVAFYNSSGTWMQTDHLVNNVSFGASWSKKSGQFTPPSGAATATARVYNHSSSSSLNLLVDRMIIREANAGELIVDGTLHGNKMVAKSITAGKLSVVSLDAISADLGTIVVGKANIADAAVSTLKIEGNSIFATARYSAADRLINDTYPRSNPRVVLSQTVTGYGKGGMTLSYQSYMDNTHTYDSFGGFIMEVDGVTLVEQNFGIRANQSSDATFIMPISISTTVSAKNSVAVRVLCYASRWDNINVPSNSFYTRGGQLIVSASQR